MCLVHCIVHISLPLSVCSHSFPLHVVRCNCVPQQHTCCFMSSVVTHIAGNTITPGTESVNSGVGCVFPWSCCCGCASYSIDCCRSVRRHFHVVLWSLQCDVMRWMRVRPSCTVHTHHFLFDVDTKPALRVSFC